jgi:uncharacterized membrane protein
MRAEERCPVTTYESDVDGSADRRPPDRPSDAGEVTVLDEESSPAAADTDTSASSADGSPSSPANGEPGGGDVAGADAAGRRRGWLRAVHAALVSAVAAVFAVVYGLFSVMLHMHYSTFTFDLVIFDQVVRAYAHFHRPTSAVLQAVKYGGRDVTQLADHFSPIHAVLAPLYWLHGGPASLLLAQACLFAIAIPAIWIFTRRALGATAAYLTSITFGLYWPLQSALGYDYHEVAFAVPLYAWMLERFQKRKYLHAALLSLVLLLVKEDQGLVVAVFGLLIAAHRHRRLGFGLAGAGLTAFLLTNLVLMPMFGASANQNWNYTSLGSTPGAGLAHVARHPLDTVQLLFTPEMKTDTLLWLFAPLLFASLASPLVLLALPLLLERMLSDNANHWTSAYHYNAFLAPLLVCAAVDGVRRLAALPRARLVGPAWAAVVLVVAIVLLPKWPLARMDSPGWWRFDSALDRAASATVRHVPSGVLVAAEGNIGPHLSSRCTVIGLDDPYHTPPTRFTIGQTPWAVVNTYFHPDAFQLLRDSGYRVTFTQDPYAVMYNPSVVGEIPSRTKSGAPLPAR